MAQKYTYIPILPWKRGEQVALKQTSAGRRVGVKPLILLSADQYRPSKATTKKIAGSPAEAFLGTLKDAWPSQIALDAHGVTNAKGQSALLEIAAGARASAQDIIPATRLTYPSDYNAAVKTIYDADGRGVTLRINLDEMASAASWASRWFCPPSDTDLIIDFGDEAPNVYSLRRAISQSLSTLHLGQKWRSVTIAGTSLPENFTGYDAGSHIIKRSELELWSSLSGAGLPYRLDFGDYATISLGLPPPGIAYGFPINVKYSLQSDILICRGVRTRGAKAVEQDVQLLGHAKQIVSDAKRRGRLANCWGDEVIDLIAAGSEPPGNLEKWVKIAVNRHIEVTRLNLP